MHDDRRARRMAPAGKKKGTRRDRRMPWHGARTAGSGTGRDDDGTDDGSGPRYGFGRYGLGAAWRGGRRRLGRSRGGRRLRGRGPFGVRPRAVRGAGRGGELTGHGVVRAGPGLGAAQEAHQAAADVELARLLGPDRDVVELAVVGVVDLPFVTVIRVGFKPHDELVAERGAAALLGVGVLEVDPRLALVVVGDLQPDGVAADAVGAAGTLLDPDAGPAVLGQPSPARVFRRGERRSGRQAEGHERPGQDLLHTAYPRLAVRPAHDTDVHR